MGGFIAQSRSDQGSVSDRAPERASRFFRVSEKKPQKLLLVLERSGDQSGRRLTHKPRPPFQRWTCGAILPILYKNTVIGFKKMNHSLPFPFVDQPPPGSILAPALDLQPSTRPLLEHKLSAGFPSPAADYVEKGLDLNAFLVQHKEASFFFEVVGDSMSGIGILGGDIVLVDRSVTPVHGHYVLAVIDGDYTLKRLHKRQGVIELHPENSAYAPIRLIEGQELQVWGVVSAVIRKYRV